MPSYNRVTIMGHVGAAPDVRVTAAGRPVVKLSVATNRSWKTGDNEWREETDWHNVVLFGPLAERQRDRVTKGDLVLIEGRLKRNTWTSDKGEPRSNVEVVGQWMRLLGRLAPRAGASEPLFDEDVQLGGIAASVASPTAVDADIPF